VSELDRIPIVLDHGGTAHALSMTHLQGGRVVRFGTWCGRLIEAGEDASWIDDCRDCEAALQIWRGGEEAAERRAVDLERARQSAAAAIEEWRRR